MSSSFEPAFGPDGHTESAARHEGILRQFSGRLQSALSDAQAKGSGVALMMVHVAAIDRVDAQHGFQSGNMLSGRVTRLLRGGVLRSRDEVELLARDEYVCILPGVSSEGVAMLAAQRAMMVLNAAPLDHGAGAEFADPAVGIALFPEHGKDAASLLKNAKHALLTARVRNDRIYIFRGTDDNPATDHAQFISRMVTALNQNTLALHYMPQMDLRTGRLTGAEALLRWTDEVLGQVPPYAAVQMAESNGLMDRLTQWIITSAVQQCAQFQQLVPGFRVSVNISPSNLHEPDLPFYVDRALRTWNVRGDNLVIEITETAMVDNQNATIEALSELKSHGVRLSIDDFGTGYSSMYYLARMPLDELKIDQSFVRDMLHAPSNAKIVRSLIDLAHNLDLLVVAEGVENEAIMTELAALGCDHVQGYHVGEAMPAKDLLTRLGAPGRV
ncbi:MAG TPA: GGDEF domain-containing phosphodiesterase [Gallionellaceae bacterium]|nr:GGDEF domain-containing phosphodiesterase [Gallionellaceae bacterium]